MSAQSRAEEALRKVHQMLSAADTDRHDANLVLINRAEMQELLNRLSDCMYDMMDDYELTAKGKDKAQRKLEKQQEETIRKANRQAEQIYASSIMYTERALRETSDVIDESKGRDEEIFQSFMAALDHEKEVLKTNRLDLKAQLQTMKDAKIYAEAIENIDRKLEAQKQEAEDIPAPVYEKPEIIVNEAYISMMSEPEMQIEQEMLPGEEQGADLDAEYFNWTEDQTDETT